MSDNAKKEIISSFLEGGENKLYKDLIVQSVKRIIKLIEDPESTTSTPDRHLISLSESFLSSYRKGEDDSYLHMSKIIRRAAHKVHRLLLKKHLVKKDDKFLNLV